ncbi:MAG: radical SAM protein [Desulfomonilaceae bacterium]|nr:radical SAM protein [Desulfomonilaceae bacterium]
MTRTALLLGMPFWIVDYPLHSLGYVAGIFTQAGWRCRIEDFNIKVFRFMKTEKGDDWFSLDGILWDDDDPLAFYDEHRDDIEDALRAILEEGDFDLVAFSVSSSSADFALEASSFIKSLVPHVPVLFGGPDCFPSEHGTRYFEEEGAPDIICQGEAEICLPQFLGEFETTGDYRTSCKGFVYRAGEDLIDTGEPEIPRFDRGLVHPDWSQIDFSLYKQPGDFPTFLSRGCVNRCAFCSESNNFKRFRVRKPAEVMAEIKESVRRVSRFTDRPTIHFSDSLINGNMRRLEEFCDLLLESGLTLQWTASARLRPEMTHPVLEKMKKSGCKELHWGLESTCQKVLDLMNKNCRWDVAKRVLLDAHAVGIRNAITLIVGFPGETVQDFVESALSVMEIRDCAFFYEPNMLSVEPNSPLHENYEKWGLQDNSCDDWITADERNDEEVRILRRFVMSNVVFNPTLALKSLDDGDELSGLDLNQFSVASELAGMLYEMWMLAGKQTGAAKFLSTWNGRPVEDLEISHDEILYWRPSNVPGTIDLTGWFSTDKTSRQAKLVIVKHILEGFRQAYAHTHRSEVESVSL